jgi:hypothetical protein
MHATRTYKLTYLQRKNCNTFDLFYLFNTPCMLKVSRLYNEKGVNVKKEHVSWKVFISHRFF